MISILVPSKNEWGRKRVDFYVNAASRTREDGILNEEEQEVLELEEEDALERQHKLDSVNTALDYKKMGNIFEDSSSDDEEEEKSEKQVKPLKTQPTRRVHFSKNLVEKQALPSSSKNDQQQINGVSYSFFTKSKIDCIYFRCKTVKEQRVSSDRCHLRINGSVRLILLKVGTKSRQLLTMKMTSEDT